MSAGRCRPAVEQIGPDLLRIEAGGVRLELSESDADWLAAELRGACHELRRERERAEKRKGRR